MSAQIDSVCLRWNGVPIGDWKLGTGDRAALDAGGYRPLHRTFTRPEPHALDLELRMTNGSSRRGQAAVSPLANRLTILVLDVHGAAVESRVWMP
jgi:hypothetical protein